MAHVRHLEETHISLNDGSELVIKREYPDGKITLSISTPTTYEGVLIQLDDDEVSDVTESLWMHRRGDH